MDEAALVEVSPGESKAAVKGRFWGLKVTLSSRIMEVENYPKIKETTVGGTHFSTEP